LNVQSHDSVMSLKCSRQWSGTRDDDGDVRELRDFVLVLKAPVSPPRLLEDVAVCRRWSLLVLPREVGAENLLLLVHHLAWEALREHELGGLRARVGPADRGGVHALGLELHRNHQVLPRAFGEHLAAPVRLVQRAA
jgi:hypothetical protein